MSIAIGPSSLPISGDQVQLQQVILNLIVNAMDAMSSIPASGRQLAIWTSLRDEFAEVAISDAGPGIPPDKLSDVFEPFFTTKAHGMGMGLSIRAPLSRPTTGRYPHTIRPKGARCSVYDCRCVNRNDVVIEVAAPTGRVLALAKALGLGGVEDFLDATANARGCLGLHDPDRLENRKDVVDRHGIDRHVAEWGGIGGERRLPLRAVLLVSEPR